MTQPPPPVAAGGVRAPESAVGERLDRVLMSCVGDLTRSAVQRLIDDGHVLVNGAPSKAGYRLRRGDEIRWEIPPRLPTEILPEAIPLEVVFEDEDLLVINKPKGMVVHPAPGNWSGTLVNALLARPPFGQRQLLAAAGGADRPGIVHRLDKDTSGLLVVARNESAFRSLQRQIQNRSAERLYLAVVRGSPKFERARVEAPIGRHPQDRKRMVVIPPGSERRARPAVTELRVLERLGPFTLLEAKLETGRTHQVRVHCAYIGHAVVGDAAYGPTARAGRGLPADERLPEAVRAAVEALEGQALHAWSLAFVHPRTGERLRFTAGPPADTARLLEALGSCVLNRPAGTMP